ncbi:MAG: 30S ribosome-binding factor RbfA [Elusimicrobiales bacterium]|nr:30S ribosome-binding factor RbfA [Elusimicrobiales bacterium]
MSFALKDINGLNSYGILTLTGVSLSKDSKNMDIYFSVYGSETDKTQSHRILNKSVRFIRQSLKTRLRLRIIPNIEFKFDDTPDKASKIEEILTRIHKDDGKK